jgi:hypothetical protein
MTKSELLQLERLSALTPKEISAQDPSLFQKLGENAADSLRRNIELKVKTLPANVRSAVNAVSFRPADIGRDDIRNILRRNINMQPAGSETKAETEAIVSKLPDLGKLDDILKPETPIRFNPAFQQELTKAKLFRITDLSQLAEETVKKAMEKNLNLNTISDEKLDELVTANILTNNEAKDLGLNTSIFLLADSNLDLTKQIKADARINNIEELVKIDRGGWLKLITDSKMQLPEELSKEDYAEVLFKKTESLFPIESLRLQIEKDAQDDIIGKLTAIRRLVEKNDILFGITDPVEINKDNLASGEFDAMSASYDSLQEMARTYPAFGIADILNNKNEEIGKRDAEIKRRLQLVPKFIDNNPDIDYLTINFAHDSEDLTKLNFQNFEPAEIKMVLSVVKAQQRIFSFTNDIEDTKSILKAGFQSAWQINSVTLENFTRNTGLSPIKAKKYFENAQQTIVRTSGLMGSIIDVVAGGFDSTNVGNTGPGIQDYLRDIPGYEDLFGKLAYCDCEHCQSIYSPAAYYVDLMQYIDKYVTKKYFTGANASHVLNLKVRRPDLWTLPLTCENTNDLVPALEIINSILATYIAKNKGFVGDLSNRTLVDDFVFKGQVALEGDAAWKDKIFSFSQPFHLPHAEVGIYLEHFELNREKIALLLGLPDNDLAKATLNLTEKNYELITGASTSKTFLEHVYGISFAVNGAGKVIPFDAQLLLQPMELTRKELGRVIKTRFVTNKGADIITIIGEKTDATSLQNEIERIHELTYSALDRAHRFVRLLRKTGLSIEELDLVLGTLEAVAGGYDITPVMIVEIGKIIRIQAKLKLTLEEVVAICFAVPSITVNEGKKSLFNILFNPSDIPATEGLYPKDTTTFIHPVFIKDKSTAPGEFLSGRLMGALTRTDAEILVLIQQLSQPLGVVNFSSDNEAERGFKLTSLNLSLLYRHSKLAQSLNIKIEELFQMIKLIPGTANPWLSNAADIKTAVDFYDWWKTTGFSLDELHFIIESNNVINPAQFRTKQEVIDATLSQVKSANALFFADTLFAYSAGVTEEQSKSIISANAAVIEISPDAKNYWLRPDFNPATPITVPAGITKPEPELRLILAKFHPAYLVPFHFSGQLALSEAAVTKMIRSLGINLDDNSFTLELQSSVAPAALLQLAEKLIPLSRLFKNRKYDNEVLAYVLDHMPLFEIANIDTISINNIQLLNSFLSHIVKNEDGTSNLPVAVAVLGAFAAATQFSTAPQDKLAELLQGDAGVLSSIHARVAGMTNAMLTLEKMKKYMAVCYFTGMGAEVLPKICSIAYTDLQEASLSILAAFRSKYKTEEDRKGKLEKYQDRLRAMKRTSLTTFLIHSGFPQFKDEKDLFYYFLIDTELGGCARTSWLVAYTMSLQVYIHRILLNHEQDDQPPGTVGRIHVKPDDIPGEEWEWRKNYRVWEANRKVFLYPENYIEPEFRDDKTPLFKELENELLQQDINADTVLGAYGKYMHGFDEIAHIKFAGSYQEFFNRDLVDQSDVVHLFGATADDPPVFYYRRIENISTSEKSDNKGIVWGGWEKINVQISARKVAPIVFNGRLHVFWVKVTTLANTVFDNNKSVFTGYSHKCSIEFTTLKLDNTWTAPQKLGLKENYPFSGNGIIEDPLVEELERAAYMEDLSKIFRSWPFFTWEGDWDAVKADIEALKTPRYDTKPHYEPIDEYTLSGFMWDQVYPNTRFGKLVLTGMGYQMRAYLDFYNLKIHEWGSPLSPGREMLALNGELPAKFMVYEGNRLYRGKNTIGSYFDNFAYTSLLTNTTKGDVMLNRHWNGFSINLSFDNIKQEDIASLKADSKVSVVNGTCSDVIIETDGDQLLVVGSATEDNSFLIKRLSTTLSETLTRTLFTSGVDAMLNIETQKALKEVISPVGIVNNRIENQVVSGKIDYKGSLGVYYREIYFHIPFLIANHLNSQGKYADAQRWYNYIFNPTATEVIDVSNPALTAAQKKKLEVDRNWQYLEFRQINVQTLHEQLTDKQAIEVYKKDPFNPHAIARLRMSAYQKSIVMKYIDNLLDWGDQLFTLDTMESVNEATLLYIIASDILGKRPEEIGGCGEEQIDPKTYETIQPYLNAGSEFLAELEHYTVVRKPKKPKGPHLPGRPKQYAVDSTLMFAKATKVSNDLRQKKGIVYNTTASIGSDIMATRDAKVYEMNGRPELVNVSTVNVVNESTSSTFDKAITGTTQWIKNSYNLNNIRKIPSFGYGIVKQVSQVFCVPGNKDLLEYYNRVEDRLYKIHNCMNILGQVRQLALFAPEIDPRLLVRAKAAGLSLDEILGSINGNLPPYRFTYILDRAKAFTAAVQGFGSSLLAALEKKNNEELNLLRLTQAANLLQISSKSRKLEIDSANESIKALNDRIDSLNYEIEYYDSLISEDMIGSERLQQIMRHTSSVLTGGAAILDTLAGIGHLIPQIGSPFAMKYGGLEIGTSASSWAGVARDFAGAIDAVGASAGLEAGFTRRSDGWKHSKKLLESELKQSLKNLTAAEIRRDIFIESQKIHERTIQQNNEIMEFYGEKFSNLGLYTWQSTVLQKLFKESFNHAYAIARLAEQAYRFERDETEFFVENNYFESARAGLLAGERLQLALQSMEKRYLETNYRKNEIDQPFSLTQLDPGALIRLKQTGLCEFSIAEIFFDLFYPGQFRRKIQSVRLTIPTVTGPYINVSATLSLTGSKIRMDAKMGAAELKEVPKSRTTTIATSTAQNDAGVFQLSFRDERYMPFEGAGAVSAWKLSLPKNFRQFDYNTINDVIIHVSYTAEYDELFRDNVEAQNDAIEGTLVNVLKNSSLSRTFSFRQEFSTDFHRLTNQPQGQPVLISIEKKHFPIFLNARPIKITAAKLIVVVAEGQTINQLEISINGSAQSGFAIDPSLGNLYSKDLGNLFGAGIMNQHTFSITNGGDIAGVAPAVGPTPAINNQKLKDILIYFEYCLA